MGFSNVKGFTFCTLQLVDSVHGLAITMGGDGVSNVSAGAGEGVGGMVNGAGLTSESIARSGACGSGSSVGAETHVDNELVVVGEFTEGDRGGFHK